MPNRQWRANPDSAGLRDYFGGHNSGSGRENDRCADGGGSFQFEKCHYLHSSFHKGES